MITENSSTQEPAAPAWVAHLAQDHPCERCGAAHIGTDLVAIILDGGTSTIRPCPDRPEMTVVLRCPRCGYDRWVQHDPALDESVEAVEAIYRLQARHCTRKKTPYLLLAE